MRYIADIPLLKDEDKEVAEEALKCIKESYKHLTPMPIRRLWKKPMEEEEKKEQTACTAPAQDEVPAPAPAEPKTKGRGTGRREKEDGCGDMAK